MILQDSGLSGNYLTSGRLFRGMGGGFGPESAGNDSFSVTKRYKLEFPSDNLATPFYTGMVVLTYGVFFA